MKKLLLIFLLFGCTIAYSQGKDTTNLKLQQVDMLGQELQQQVVTLQELKQQVETTNQELEKFILDREDYLIHISIVLGLIGLVITIFVGIAGVVVPLIMDSSRRKQVKDIEAKLIKIEDIETVVKGQRDQITLLQEKFDKQEKAAKEFAEEANISALFSEAYNEKDTTKQIELYTKVIGIDPENASAYNNRGVAYRKKGEYDNAIADYTKAIEIDPKYALAYYNRGIAYSEKGESDKAIEDYKKAIEIDNSHAAAYNNLAYIYCGDGDIVNGGDAIRYINKAIKLEPTEAIYYLTKFEIYEILAEQEEDVDKKLEYQKIASENKAIYDELSKVK